MKKKKWIGAGIVAIIVVLIAGVGVYKYNSYSAKKDCFLAEYGETLNMDPAKYVKANQTAVAKTKLDFSGVDVNKVGKYKAYATYKNKTVRFTVNVKDSKNPEIEVKDSSNIIVNKKVKASDLVKKVSDASGIKSLQITGCDVEKVDAGNLDKYILSFPKAGENQIDVIAEDNNHNQSKLKMTVKVTEDYVKHVKGIQNIKVIKGEKVNWMNGIKKDKLIKKVQADDSKVNLKKTGKYKLVYKITGSDDIVVTKTVRVIVKNKPVVTVAKSNNYNRAAASGNTTGRTYNSNRSSYSRRSSNSGYGRKSSSSRRSSSRSSSGKSSKKKSDEYKPGQEWSIKYRERNVDIGNGSTADSFDW